MRVLDQVRANSPPERRRVGASGRPSAHAEDGRDPLWYKDAVLYELHVRAFHDSNGDGIGDFPGLIEKLDYLRDLGVSALWLLPFYPSPLLDDGYDIADYRDIHPSYGTMDDFRRFLDEAHQRELKVITELVINHTSDQHPWFQRARRAPPGSAERDFYVWTEHPQRYAEARIIFQDFERSNWTWDAQASAYYWHRFYHHQPDLNFDNPRVREEVLAALDYWFEMGVDGMRLDAIPYLYERDGTNCENLPETHAFLKELRSHLDARFVDRMLLAEANQWPEDAAAYFGVGDECHMNFHFPIMPRLFMALRMEDRFPIVDILEQTPDIPASCQWALFLRNHDELTLEMVTDEERDYMHEAYARDREARINLGIRRRLAPLLENHRRKIELLDSLLFSLPGTPVLYYGDEIGMGDNVYLGDRNGVRTPMQWSADRNAGFSRCNPQRLFLPVVIDPEHHFESVNVETQLRNPSSLLWWTRRLIALRRRHPVFGRGTMEWLDPGNAHVLAFLRRSPDETILVVANLSRFVQAAEVDLAAFEGMVPVELFGRTPLPAVGDRPYALTLGPHDFFWFELRPRLTGPRRAAVEPEDAHALPPMLARGADSWDDLLDESARPQLEAALVPFLYRQRWFAGKTRQLRYLRVDESLPLEWGGPPARLILLRAEYAGEEADTYVLPLALARGDPAARILQERPRAIVCRLEGEGGAGVVFDALQDSEHVLGLLDGIAYQRSASANGSRLVGMAGGDRGALVDEEGGSLAPVPGRAEQSNTSIRFGNRWMLKVYRRLEPGTNLDREVGEVLTDRGFPHSPAVAGALEYRTHGREPATLAVLQRFVPNQGDAWELTVDAVDRFLERALASPRPVEQLPAPEGERRGVDPAETPRKVADLVGAYLERAPLLGRRTGELHLALGAPTDDAAFAPEPFTRLYQRSLYQSHRNQAGRTFRVLARLRDELDEGRTSHELEAVLARRDRVLDRFRRVLDRRLDGLRIRVHGDYHLGQVLHTGRDFVIIDFEGEPARSVAGRRLKRSPLRDVAGMLRSFEYAAAAGVRTARERGVGSTGPEGSAVLSAWAELWRRWAAAWFLWGYERAVEGSGLLPTDPEGRASLLEAFLLEKALYEAVYEAENRPDWIRVPLEGILELTA